MTRMFTFARVGVLLIWMLSGAANAEDLIPLDYFTRSDELGTMKLSPDGEFLAITTGEHGGEFLTFVNLKDGKVVSGVRAPEGLVIHDFYWASNTRAIFMIAERQPGRVQPTATGEIFAVDRDGGRQVRIYGYRAGEMSTGTHRRVRQANYATARVVSLLDDDDRNILIAEMPWRLKGSTYYYNRDAKPELTKLYRCAIGYAGVYDLQLMFDSGDIPTSKMGLSYLGEVLGNDPADLRARSPVTHANAIEIPVLLIHGKEDWRADYKQATRLKAELEKLKKRVEWLPLRGEGHGVYDDATRLQMYEGILEFLGTHLAAAATAAQ